jgi:hypothetical protein
MNLDIKIYRGEIDIFIPNESNEKIIKEKKMDKDNKKTKKKKSENKKEENKENIDIKKENIDNVEGEKEIEEKKKEEINEEIPKEETIEEKKEIEKMEIKENTNENHKGENETEDKIKSLFESIKNFNQLKNEVYEMKKHYEYLNQLTLKTIKEKQENNLIEFNNKIADINKKFNLLLGDIKPDDLEFNDTENNGVKAMNLSEIITRLKAFQFSKANITDLNQMNEDFDFRIKELSNKIRDIKFSLFGSDKDADNKINDNNNNTGQDESSKNAVNMPRLTFVSKTDFEKLKTDTENEFDKVWKEINSLRLVVDNISDKINNKASLNDLEDLKNIILQKTEELFLNQNKKHVNYSSTIKILQENFKKLLKLLSDKEQYYEKNKFSMGDNPLNLGGHSCASCENYLGDLNSEQKYVNWNKFPKKERDNNGDILKRVQNGYSRLLQMINFDNNGNPSLLPYNNNSINKETNVSSNVEDNLQSNEKNEKNDANQSFSNKRLFSTKVKKLVKENDKSKEFLNLKKEPCSRSRKLPSIKTSKSIDNLNILKYKSSQHMDKKDINFINPAISKVVQESDEINT